jgi:outer membrane protein TolC
MKKIYLFLLFILSSNILIGPNVPTDNKIEPKVVVKEPKTLTIEQVVAQALTKKPSVHAFHHAIKSLERQRKGTLSTFLPNVSLSETFYNNNNTSAIKSSFGLSASQTVINLAKVNHYRMFSASVSGAKHDKEAHKDTIRLAAESAFLSAWLLQQKLNLILLLFNSSVETFGKSKKQFELNLTDKNDWLKSKTTHAGNLVTVNNYHDDIADSEKLLEFYIQSKIALLLPRRELSEKTFFPTGLFWNPHQKIEPEPFVSYYKQALKNRKDLKSKQEAINLQAETSQYYAKQYIPSVSVFADVSKNTSRIGNSYTSKSAGLKISWSAFDGLTNYFNKSSADAEKMKAILEKGDLANQIKLEVQQAYSALRKELDSLEKEKISFNQATNEFDLKKQQLKAGLIDSVAFQTAKYNYENSRLTWLSQAVTASIKERELQKTCGYPTKI